MTAAVESDAPPAHAIPAPRFSVVIPTYQRRDLVTASVRALARQEYSGSYEIIVVVDGSTDGSAEALRALDVPLHISVHEQPNRGASVARNRGASVTRGEILLFLDDDMEADPHLLAELDGSFQSGADVVFGHLPLHPGSPQNFLSDGIRQWTDGRLQRLSSDGESLTLHDLMTGQMSLPRILFERMGGFDTNFTRDGTFGGEDIDFGYRLMRAGYRLVFNPRAISYQNYVVRPPQYLRQWRQAGQSDVAFARKHPEQASAIFALNGSRKRMNRWVWQPVAAMSPLSVPIMNALRWLALRVVDRPAPGDRSIRFFYQIWAMEYWRGVREAGGMPRPRALRVLAYHAIEDLRGAPIVEAYAVPPQEFRRHLDWLRRAGFRFVSSDEVLHFLRREGGLPHRPVFLTFDDAYEDLLEVVPVLRERGIPAAVFAVSSRLGGSNVWDEAIGAPRLGLLDSDGLKALAEANVEVGAHSRTHRPLTRLTGSELTDEVAGSLAELEAALGERPRMFVYPEGDHDERVRAEAESAGVESAFTTVAGLVRAGQDPYAVPRIEILRGDRGWKFLWKILRAGRWGLSRSNRPRGIELMRSGGSGG